MRLSLPKGCQPFKMLSTNREKKIELVLGRLVIRAGFKLRKRDRIMERGDL